MPVRYCFLLVCFTAVAFAALTPAQKAANLDSFEKVWSTVRDRHPDGKLDGLDWQKIHDTTKIRIENAGSMDEARGIITEMLGKLNTSHYAVIPGDRYDPAAKTDGPGTAVTFGNLPQSRLEFEAKLLPGGAGYVRFNEFLDPVSIMPKMTAALKEFAKSPGVILDLRGNRGGIAAMAMGIAGFFIDKPGLKLGTMTMQGTELKFAIFPRLDAYRGKLAIVVDGGSASTTEILAQGLQDLKRARVFGEKTMGAALPSDILRLPNGDGFQFAQAGYTSVNGRVLEGAGVIPDVATDEPIEAAKAWIAGQ